MDEEQQEDGSRHDAVDADDERLLAHAIDDEAREWGEERRQHEHEEHEPCSRIAVREVLGPDPEDEEHRRVPEHRQTRAN